MPQKITAEISAEQFTENFGFEEASGLYNDPLFRLVVNKFGRCYWLLAHDNLQGPRFSGNNVYYQGNNSRLIRTIYPNANRIVDVGANVGNNTIAYSVPQSARSQLRSPGSPIRSTNTDKTRC